MKAEIITIGDELLSGFTVDTNSSWMGQRLLELGIEVVRKMAISDKKADICNALTTAMQNSQLVLITGGLGPTNDDITKHTLCEYFNTRLVMHNEAYRNAERFVLERGGSMNVLNQGQALFPESARFVPNNNGTASGMWFEQNGCVVVSLPGVPHEMKQMMTETVLPLLEKEYVRQSIVYKNLLTVGIPESQLAIYLTNWEAALPQTVKLAYLPAPGQVILRLSTSGNNKEELVQLLDGLVAQIPQVVTQQIISYTGETIPQIVGRLLKQQKQSISTAESCTGGSIASAITALSGSSEWFMGSVVAYSNAVKRDVLGVAQQTLDAYGAVSEPVVLAMAEGVKKLTATNWAVSVSGIAGPSGGSAEKPVGTVWIAVSSPRRTIAKRFQFAPTSGREVIITRTVSAALLMVLDEMKL